MNILGHIIADDQVIGIGPLEEKSDEDIKNINYDKRLHFDIYLRRLVVRIQSKWFVPRQQKEFEKFRTEYENIRKTILEKVSPAQSAKAGFVGPKMDMYPK